MADSIRERILTRIKTNLDAATGGVTVYRSRVEPLAVAKCQQSSLSL